MHKITKDVMGAEEATRPTPCLTEPERWFPDDQKPDPYAVAACWSCHFQPACARRALDQREEFGVWGGYRLAPGPKLERTRTHLEIVAGREMGPAVPPIPAVIAALEDLAGTGDQPATPMPVSVQAETTMVYPPLELAAAPVDLPDWAEPTAQDLIDAQRDELDARWSYPLDLELLVDGRGQILLPLEPGAALGSHSDRAVVKRAS
jgi:hypothetical protein